ncbi:MAG: ABC transporter, partial [Thiomicrorhabdus sp.]|nr:ABC transporter [Thiomicrorhabdus sp.]
ASIADQYWWVHQGKVSHFMGDLDAYLQMRLKTLKEQATAAKPAKTGQNKKQARQANAQQRKQFEARLKPVKQAIKKIDKELETLQSQQTKLHTMMEDSTLYEANNKEKLAKCLKEQAICEQAIENAEMEWLDLQETLETEQALVEESLG